VFQWSEIAWFDQFMVLKLTVLQYNFKQPHDGDILWRHNDYVTNNMSSKFSIFKSLSSKILVAFLYCSIVIMNIACYLYNFFLWQFENWNYLKKRRSKFRLLGNTRIDQESNRDRNCTQIRNILNFLKKISLRLLLLLYYNIWQMIS